MRFVMTNKSMLSMRGDPRELWQSIFCIALVGLAFRPANQARLKQRTTKTAYDLLEHAPKAYMLS